MKSKLRIYHSELMLLVVFWVIMALFASMAFASPKSNDFPQTAEKPHQEAYVASERVSTEVIGALVYAYSSRPQETDDDPFTTASGQKVREGIVANNCLSFGTKVKINGNTYEVQDRMNKRYSDCSKMVFDIWFSDTKDAINWGKKELQIQILDN